ncbi:hypothetical protein COLO4_36994 [Corchorus olitorius]|uniref:Uncharacterized protein n=1 Tax=Corchorus olitorius TaxID=93759 RepID=A0A1R3G3W1_9ROSI|nr:hypothetical protein COLO4_36994 [Corchorus olitorius]
MESDARVFSEMPRTKDEADEKDIMTVSSRGNLSTTKNEGKKRHESKDSDQEDVGLFSRWKQLQLTSFKEPTNNSSMKKEANRKDITIGSSDNLLKEPFLREPTSNNERGKAEEEALKRSAERKS